MNPFKLGLATDDLFCNRVAEIEYLSRNMLSGIHTVVYAPRRYGKTSLARVVMARLENKMVGIYVDLSLSRPARTLRNHFTDASCRPWEERLLTRVP